MNSFSIWHWIVAIFWVAVFLIPGWRIASSAGYNGAWSLLLLVPLLNIVVLWVFAFVRWPANKAS